VHPVELLVVVSELVVYLAELFIVLLAPALPLLDRPPGHADVAVSPFDLLTDLFLALFQVLLHLVQPADDAVQHVFLSLGELILEMLQPPFQQLKLLLLVR